MKRIGLFGGTFNPIHLGHTRMIREVSDRFSLSRAILIPAAAPPHKNASNIAPAGDRFEMTRLAAAAEDADIEVSDIELKRRGKSYTIDTVRSFHSDLADSAHLLLIMGLDAILEIHTWKSYRRLLEEIDFIVAARPGLNETNQASGRKQLECYLQSAISESYMFSESQNVFEHPRHKRIFYFEGGLIDISSTRIREHLKKGKPIDHMVPEPVKRYIFKKGLYNK